VTGFGLVVSGFTAFAVESVTTNPSPATHDLDPGYSLEGFPDQRLDRITGIS
jgi:hypothetical protein